MNDINRTLADEVLKSCPFCAGHLIEVDDDGDAEWLECQSCGARGPWRITTTDAPDDEEPLPISEQWNRRPTKSEGDVEALIATAEECRKVARDLREGTCDCSTAFQAAYWDKKAETFLSRAAALEPPRSGTPAGWRLVPEEPTRAMSDAGWDAIRDERKRVAPAEQYGDTLAILSYRAMLAAAPQPPVLGSAEAASPAVRENAVWLIEKQSGGWFHPVIGWTSNAHEAFRFATEADAKAAITNCALRISLPRSRSNVFAVENIFVERAS